MVGKADRAKTETGRTQVRRHFADFSMPFQQDPAQNKNVDAPLNAWFWQT
jgi:hypothetical protein